MTWLSVGHSMDGGVKAAAGSGGPRKQPSSPNSAPQWTHPGERRNAWQAVAERARTGVSSVSPRDWVLALGSWDVVARRDSAPHAVHGALERLVLGERDVCRRPAAQGGRAANKRPERRGEGRRYRRRAPRPLTAGGHVPLLSGAYRPVAVCTAEDVEERRCHQGLSARCGHPAGPGGLSPSGRWIWPARRADSAAAHQPAQRRRPLDPRPCFPCPRAATSRHGAAARASRLADAHRTQARSACRATEARQRRP